MEEIFLKVNIDFFDLKDAKDILKLGLIGLGFFLCFFSYRLVFIHLTGSAKKKRSPILIFAFMLFSVIIMLTALAYKFIDTPDFISLFFQGEKVSVDPNQRADPKKIDSLRDFRNDNYEFSYLLPGEEWNRPIEYNGLQAVIELNIGKNDSGKYYNKVVAQLESSPLKEMLLQQRLFVVERKDSQISIELIDETLSPQIQAGMEFAKKNSIVRYGLDTTKVEDKVQLAEILKEQKRTAYLQPKQLYFGNRFSVTVYNKSLLPIWLSKMSTADLLKYELPLLPSVSQLSADQGAILLEGVSSYYENVLVDGKKSDFRMNKLILLQENIRFFYIVEVSYSPQTQMPTQVLDELAKFIKSFKAYKD